MEEISNGLVWSDDEILATSTPRVEAKVLSSVGSEGQGAHQRTSSGSTPSSASLTTDAGQEHEAVNVQPRTWADVVAGKRHYGDSSCAVSGGKQRP